MPREEAPSLGGQSERGRLVCSECGRPLARASKPGATAFCDFVRAQAVREDDFAALGQEDASNG